MDNDKSIIPLEFPDKLKFVRVTALEFENTLNTEASLVKFKVEFKTHTIPEEGYIVVEVPLSMKTPDTNPITWRC